MTSTVTDGVKALKPCRECGHSGRAEMFGDTVVWICSNHKWFGGNCPSETAYLTKEAWNTRPQPEGVEALVERLRKIGHYSPGYGPSSSIRLLCAEAADKLEALARLGGNR